MVDEINLMVNSIMTYVRANAKQNTYLLNTNYNMPMPKSQTKSSFWKTLKESKNYGKLLCKKISDKLNIKDNSVMLFTKSYNFVKDKFSLLGSKLNQKMAGISANIFPKLLSIFQK